MHIPTAGHGKPGLPFMVVVILLDVVIYKLVFGKKHYDWIKRKFVRYSASELRLPLVFFSMIPLFMGFIIMIYAVGVDPVRGTLVMLYILAGLEVIFRIWWVLFKPE